MNEETIGMLARIRKKIYKPFGFLLKDFLSAFCRHKVCPTNRWYCPPLFGPSTYFYMLGACDDRYSYIILNRYDLYCRVVYGHDNCPESPYTLIYYGMVVCGGRVFYYCAVHSDELAYPHVVELDNFWNSEDIGQSTCFKVNIYVTKVSIDEGILKEEGDEMFRILDKNINSSKTPLENTEYIINLIKRRFG